MVAIFAFALITNHKAVFKIITTYTNRIQIVLSKTRK